MKTHLHTCNVIIHRSALQRYRQGIVSGAEKAGQVCKIIDQLLASDPDCVDWDSGHPKDVAKLFCSGDRVVLYGCYLGMCLSVAEGTLRNKGVEVSFSPDGVF